MNSGKPSSGLSRL